MRPRRRSNALTSDPKWWRHRQSPLPTHPRSLDYSSWHARNAGSSRQPQHTTSEGSAPLPVSRSLSSLSRDRTRARVSLLLLSFCLSSPRHAHSPSSDTAPLALIRCRSIWTHTYISSRKMLPRRQESLGALCTHADRRSVICRCGCAPGSRFSSFLSRKRRSRKSARVRVAAPHADASRRSESGSARRHALRRV